jgi:hypothetical protein
MIIIIVKANDTCSHLPVKACFIKRAAERKKPLDQAAFGEG